MSRTKAFLLAAGLGTRLGPLTDWTPKCLLTVAGRPLLSWWIDKLADAGVGQALVNTHAHASQVREFLARENRTGPVNLVESYELTLLGSAGAITANANWADNADDIILINSDNFSSVDLRQLLTFHRSHDDPMTMLLFRTPNPQSCGIATLDGSNRVVRFTEKPAQPESDLANAGVYVVRASAYREIANLSACDLGFDVLPRFVGRTRGWEWTGYHRDVGTPASLEEARRDAPFLRADRKSETPALRPAVFLDRDGTLIEDVPYLCRPEQVRLLPGAAKAVNLLRKAGYACIVATNQSGIGRGMYGEAEMQRCNQEMRNQLNAAGADLDGLYYCPAVPISSDRTRIEHADRKPGSGMLQRAARDLELDLSRSWMVGDMISDALAGHNAGCLGNILLTKEKPDRPLPENTLLAPHMDSAASLILRSL